MLGKKFNSGFRLVGFGGAVALVAAALAATTANGGYSASTPAGEGISYGGLHHGEALWLRLGPDRASIAVFEVPWTVPASKCSNHKRYTSFTAMGREWDRPTPVAGGRFDQHLIDRYRYRGVSYVEDFNIAGAIDAEQAAGEFQVKVTAKKRGHKRYTCKSDPMSFKVLN
jgi:hypothetical protein